ncbi:unnamed protein product [Ascophyllum nodosum]
MVRSMWVGAVIAVVTVQIMSNLLGTLLGQRPRHPPHRELELELESSTKFNGKERGSTADLTGLKSFRWSFLVVLAACNLGEFIQGAHIFKLYVEDKGLDIGFIPKMFMVGQVSSMITGPFSGAFVDRYGRRNGCMLWTVLNMLQCLLIRSKSLGVLVLGRVIAGVCTSIIATAFEAWMVTEHHNRGYPSHLMGDTFRMTVWALGAVAVVSGFLAEAAVQRKGLLAPFELAIGVSFISLLLLGRLWNENHGNHSSSPVRHIKEAWAHMMGDSRLLLMGLVQVLFEGSMLAWVVIWVPVLEAAPPSQSKAIAMGTVFSTLMVAICTGSSLFKIFTEGLPERFTLSPNACLVLATGLGTIAMAACSTGLPAAKLLLMFLVYEVCIGIYFPAMATCRSTYMDDRVRGTAMNIIRVPMNLVLILLTLGPMARLSDPSKGGASVVFKAMACLTGLSTLIQVVLYSGEKSEGRTSRDVTTMQLCSDARVRLRGRDEDTT